MQTDDSHLSFAILPIGLKISSALYQRLDAPALHSRLTASLNGLLNSLGLPALCNLEVIELMEYTFPPVQVVIDGCACPYPAHWVNQAFYHISEPMDDADDLELLSSFQTEELVSWLLLSILRLRPSRLLTPAVLQVYVSKLNGRLQQDKTSLANLLYLLLDLRISLARQNTIADTINENMLRESNPVEAAEVLIAAHNPKRLELHISKGYLREISMIDNSEDRESFKLLREGLFYETGITLPAIDVVPDDQLQFGQFYLVVNDLPGSVYRGLPLDRILVNESPSKLALLGIQDAKKYINPANQNECSSVSAENAEYAKQAGFTVWTPLGVVILRISAELREAIGAFMDKNTVENLVERLKEIFPATFTAVWARTSSLYVAPALRHLLQEGLSIRDLSHILQAILDFDYLIADDAQNIIFDQRLTVSAQPSENWLGDPLNLASFIRTTQKSYISHKYTKGQASLTVYLVDPEIEAQLSNTQCVSSHEWFAGISVEFCQQVRDAVRNELDPSHKINMPAILTGPSARPAIRWILQDEFPDLPVLSYAELSPSLNIVPLARISL